MVSVRIAAMEQALTFALADSFVDAAATGNRETARMVTELARVLGEGPPPSELTRAYETMGRNAQRSILASYGQTVTRNKRPGSSQPYRLSATNPANQRFAGGALRRALAAPDFYQAGPRGLRLINVDRLDKEARHWARLNAGAGGLGQGSRRSFEVRWSNLVIAAIGIDMSASPSFTIPRGYWFDAGSGAAVAPSGEIGAHQFFPVGEGPRKGTSRVFDRAGAGSRSVAFQPRKLTRGIKARNFLDAGVARVARDLPVVFERLYVDLYNQGVAQVRPARRPASKVTTRSRY